MTATERRSVLELARMIGYELNSGVAASTVLAFTVDEAPGSPTSAIIPKQTPSQSIPGQDELPQTFETAEDFIARLDWNALKPRSAKPQTIAATLPSANATDPLAIALPPRELYLAGTSTQLQAGDWVLLLEQDGQDGSFYLLTLDTVEAKSEAGYTVVTWKQQIPTEIKKPIVHPTLLAFRQKASFFGRNAPRGLLHLQHCLYATFTVQRQPRLQCISMSPDSLGNRTDTGRILLFKPVEHLQSFLGS